MDLKSILTGKYFFKQKQKGGRILTDIDGNIYHIVTIGTQDWMIENLKTTRYCNGAPLLNVINSINFNNTSLGAYCNYDYDESKATTYGRLYNWYAIKDSRKIAPIGWHIPTDAEWDILITFLGGYELAGSKLKEKGSKHWKWPNKGSTNESGFSALPAGGCAGGTFYGMGFHAGWRSFPESDISWGVGLYSNGVCKSCFTKNYWMFSVRCIRDN